MISNIVTVLSIVWNYDNFIHFSNDIVTIELRFFVVSSDKNQEFVYSTYLTWMLSSSFIEKFLLMFKEDLNLLMS